MRPNFIERMAAAKAAAQDRRNRGLATGKPAAGWQHRPAPMASTFANFAILTRRHFGADAREAVNEFRAACLNGRNWENELNAIPF